MAVASALPFQQPEINFPNQRHGYHAVSPSMAATSGGIGEERPAPTAEEMVFVAVGKEVRESELMLLWAIRNGGAKRIGLLHVHQPAQMIPMLGGKFPAAQVKRRQVNAYREQEREKMHKILQKYHDICAREKVPVEEFVIEMDDIERGILELVILNGINKLVMGAAADKHYSKKMVVPKSKKATVVSQEAPLACQIYFVCKGFLICTREASFDGVGVFVTPPSPVMTPYSNISQPMSLKSRTIGLSTNPEEPNELAQSLPPRSKSYSCSSCTQFTGTLKTAVGTEAPILRDGISLDSSSHSSEKSLCNDVAGSSLAILVMTDEENDKESTSILSHEGHENLDSSSPLKQMEREEVHNHIDDLLRESMSEVEACKRAAFELSIKCAKAEKFTLEALRKAKESENHYNEELTQRKEAEDMLAQGSLKLENIKLQHKEVTKELLKAREQQATLENQLIESNRALKELEGRFLEAQQNLERLKEEVKLLQRERNEAIREAEELHIRNDEASSSSRIPNDFSSFSFMEIEEATNGFDPSAKIGEGGYGSVYRGLLRHTPVAIKMLNPEGMQGRLEFEQEVDILSRVRHPNLVTLVGTCPEASSLIYEYLPNGSLEDRFACKGNSPPLSWQLRTCILADICSALLFLHSNKPHHVVHGDLKPANILLDSNFTAKLSDFGISRLISDRNSGTTLGWNTDPKGTFAYMDPAFQSTGMLTRKSDVYSLGVIILQTLTGRPGFGLVKQVKEALERGHLDRVLDELAGDWPYLQAKQLALLGLRCCEMDRKERPDLESEVMRVIEPMRALVGSESPSMLPGLDHLRKTPAYFICPIFQETMQDPHIAADGYTYEAEAIKGWLENGHDTSPVTNMKFANHELIPNHAIRSAIQEWRQHQ